MTFSQFTWLCGFFSESLVLNNKSGQVSDELISCVPAPPILSLSELIGSWAGGVTLVSCPGQVSIDKGGGEGLSYVALWRSGFASLFLWQPFSYSIHPWDGLCIWKQFPVVFQALFLSFPSAPLLLLFLPLLSVFKKNGGSSSSSLATVFLSLHVDVIEICPL